MGQKINPNGFRIQVTKDWTSRWYAGNADFADKLHEDLLIRSIVKEFLKDAAIAKIYIERFSNKIRLAIHSARPGMVIGRKGKQLEELKDLLKKKKIDAEMFIDIIEVKTPEINAVLVAEAIALQLEKRINFRRAMKKSIQLAMDMGAEGIKVACAGRLGGADLARTEHYHNGRVPLHTLKANIEYGTAEANTLSGIIGIKVWICKPDKTKEQEDAVNSKAGKTSKGAKRKS